MVTLVNNGNGKNNPIGMPIVEPRITIRGSQILPCMNNEITHKTIIKAAIAKNIRLIILSSKRTLIRLVGDPSASLTLTC